MLMHPMPATTVTPDPTKEHHVQYQTLEILVRARQEALAHEAEQRRLTRIARPREHLRGHGHVASRGSSRSFVAAVRTRLGHALVTAGTILEGGATEDTARSH